METRKKHDVTLFCRSGKKHGLGDAEMLPSACEKVKFIWVRVSHNLRSSVFRFLINSSNELQL